MKQVNKDYISIVRENSEGFSFEKIEIKKSEHLIDELTGMAYHGGFSVNDMLDHLCRSSLFVYFALPFYEHSEDLLWEEASNIKIKALVDSLDMQKTKASFLEKALELIQECDYRWNALKLEGEHQDYVMRSFSEDEYQTLPIRITDDISILVSAHNVGGDSDSELSFTVMKGEVPVLPYRSLVELYECSEDIMESTCMFDPEASQWENFMRTLAATANYILNNKEDYFRKAVIEDGLMMADKITQMCTDIDGYLKWLSYEREDVQIEYSDNDADISVLDTYDEQYRELYKLYSVGFKLSYAIDLASNLMEWSQLGEDYVCLAGIYNHMIKFVPEVLQRVETACKQFPEQFFDKGYRSKDMAEMRQRILALDLRKTAKALRDRLNKNNDE